jgi:hypothetical protein
MKYGSEGATTPGAATTTDERENRGAGEPPAITDELENE